MPREWEPLYPSFADAERAADRTGGVADPEDGGGGTVPWERAPDTSHLWGFRLLDSRTVPNRAVRQAMAGRTYLDVRFKPSGTATTYSDYRYVFADPAEAERVIALMREADHPGRVVHRELIGGGVPYYPVSLD